MSSPLAKKNKSWLRKLFIDSHQHLSHKTRVRIIGVSIAEIISSEFRCQKKIACLDLGCGDMEISLCIQKEIPQTSWIGTDIHDASDNIQLPFDYIKFDGKSLPFQYHEFDLVLLCDVLHHIPVSIQNRIIRECARVAKKIIIKDHFEKGLFSRLVLMAMDFLGNWAYGVSAPKKYFTKKSFTQFCRNNSLDMALKVSQMELYKSLPSLIRIMLSPELHFIAVVSPCERGPGTTCV